MQYLRLLSGALHPGERDIEARCMLAFPLVIGNHFIAADHDARNRRDVLELALTRILG